MAQAGGLKAAAKRTAFADLSNALNVPRPSKDDSAIPTKGYATVTEKSVAVIPQDKKPTALSRPAQRPLSVSGLKSLLHNVSSGIPQASVKQPLAEIQQPTQSVVQQANVKKLAKKKSTAVFKDTITNRSDQSKADTIDTLPSTAPLPVHRELPPIQHPQEEELPVESRVKTQPAHAAQVLSSAVHSSEEVAPFRSDGIYIDNNGEVQQYVFTEDSEDTEHQARMPIGEIDNPARLVTEEFLDQQDHCPDPQDEQEQAELIVKQKLRPVSEPEDYWDEEDGVYEEEGYVTARSFKSRGENTTNGVTTVVFPKVNSKIKKELAAAKELIESTKTAEEIDDETWDTSMVAEYGEEIFGYMRDLEVHHGFI